MYLEICTFRRIDSSLQKAHGSETIQMSLMCQIVFQVGSSIATYEKALKPSPSFELPSFNRRVKFQRKKCLTGKPNGKFKHCRSQLLITSKNNAKLRKPFQNYGHLHNSQEMRCKVNEGTLMTYVSQQCNFCSSVIITCRSSRCKKTWSDVSEWFFM